jgi:hypothetical protein
MARLFPRIDSSYSVCLFVCLFVCEFCFFYALTIFSFLAYVNPISLFVQSMAPWYVLLSRFFRINFSLAKSSRYNPSQQSAQQDDMMLQLAQNLGFNFGDDVDEG